MAPAPVTLDADQSRIVARPRGAGHLIVVGAPGSGKTTTAVETFLGRSTGPAPGSHPLGGSALFLTTSRQGADRVRESVGTRLTASGGGARGLVRSVASFAYAVVHARAMAQRAPAPVLVTGPQQDTILAELLAGLVADGAGENLAALLDVIPHALELLAGDTEHR